MTEKLNKIRNNIKESRSLIHCITNHISINQCANAVLALGAKPIMAENPREVAEITQTANALMMNMGNINDSKMKAISIALETAKKNNIPAILDAVGIGCSALRRDFVFDIADRICPDVIKGNYSEINALYNMTYISRGVDADDDITVEMTDKISVELSRKYNAIILASGKTDVITDGKRLVHINNGTPMLSMVTGTGCMLGALCACCMAVCNDTDGIICAASVLGICGELAETAGTGSFATGLMDKLSVISNSDIEERLRMEEIEIVED